MIDKQKNKDKTTFIADLVHWLEIVLLIVIVIATTISLLEVLWDAYTAWHVSLSDILLLFIYLEIYAMIGIYYTTNSLPIRYPIYIAIVALARYITLEAKNLAGVELTYLGVTVLIMALAVLAIRFGHTQFPYEKRQSNNDGDER